MADGAEVKTFNRTCGIGEWATPPSESGFKGIASE